MRGAKSEWKREGKGEGEQVGVRWAGQKGKEGGNGSASKALMIASTHIIDCLSAMTAVT